MILLHVSEPDQEARQKNTEKSAIYYLKKYHNYINWVYKLSRGAIFVDFPIFAQISEKKILAKFMLKYALSL